MTALQGVAAISGPAYVLALISGTAITSGMIYLPLAADHLLILIGVVVIGWLVGGLYGLVYGRRYWQGVQGAAPATVH